MSLRTADLLDAVDWVARDQRGLVTAAQLDEIGIPRSTLSRRIRTGGQWRRVLPGVYNVADGPLSIDQRDMAGLLFAGPDAVLTGASGLRLGGIEYLPHDPQEELVHALIPITRHRKSSGFVIVERSKRTPPADPSSGLPCAPLARCIVDAARRVTHRRTTRAFTLEAVQRGLVTVDEIAEELRLAQRRGTALLRECLAEARAGVRSAPEAELRHHMARAGLPAALWNPILRRPNGAFVAQPDGLIQESMTVLEVQSQQYHGQGQRFVSTLDRASKYGSLGLLVVHIVPAEFRRNPLATLRLITETHREGLSRPRPNLVVEDARGRRPSTQ